jgi:hypothetical protein
MDLILLMGSLLVAIWVLLYIAGKLISYIVK